MNKEMAQVALDTGHDVITSDGCIGLVAAVGTDAPSVRVVGDGFDSWFWLADLKPSEDLQAAFNMYRAEARRLAVRKIREYAIAMLPIPNYSDPGVQRYLCIVENKPGREYVVGQCSWNDTEWEAGRYLTNLPAAIRNVADRMEALRR